MAINEELGVRKLRRKIIFEPKVLIGAGKDCFGVGAVAAQLAGEAHYALQIGLCRFFSSFLFFSIIFQAALGFAGQVFYLDCIFLMRFICRRSGLVVKAQGAGFCIVKFCQLTNLIARNSHLSSSPINDEFVVDYAAPDGMILAEDA